MGLMKSKMKWIFLRKTLHGVNEEQNEVDSFKKSASWS